MSKIINQGNGSKKKVIIFLVAVIVILASAFAGLVVTNNSLIPEQIRDFFGVNGPKIVDRTNDDIENIIFDIDLQAETGDIDGAKSNLDNYISQTEDPYQKRELIISKSTVYFNNEEYDESLKLAFQAEEMKKDEGIESFIADVYYEKGEYETAIKYYESAIELADSEADHTAYYQNEIDYLRELMQE